MKKSWLLVFIIPILLLSFYRINKIHSEDVRLVNNIVRIQETKGVPHNTIVVKQTTDFLLEPLAVQNGRALVAIDSVKNFSVGQKVHGQDVVISFVSKSIDLDSGMYIVRLSKNISGTIMIEKQYTGYFLPIDAVIPDNARVMAKDADHIVVQGLNDGDKVVVQ